MYLCFSCCFNVYEEYPHLYQYEKDFEEIMLTHKEVKILYNSFRNIKSSFEDADAGSTKEILKHFNVDSTMFSKRLVVVSKQHSVSFNEFVLSIWNYCTADDDTLNDICFRLYLPQSLDFEEEICGTDMKQMLRDLYGDNYLMKHPKLSMVQKKLSGLDKVPINLEHFKEFCKTHELLTPAFETQRQLRNIFLGNKFWIKAIQKRKSLEQDYIKNDHKLKHRSIEKYLDLPVKCLGATSTSIQNHARGDEALIALIQKKERELPERRRGSREGDGIGGELSSGRPKSPGDHPSLRKRRNSREEENHDVVNRLSKVQQDKMRELTAHDLAQLKKDVLVTTTTQAIIDKRNKKNEERIRRHSLDFLPLHARIRPDGTTSASGEVANDSKVGDYNADDNRKTFQTASVPNSQGVTKRRSRESRRTF